MAQRQKVRKQQQQKQQQQQQQIAVVFQNVIEHSIASICCQHQLFPSNFFEHQQPGNSTFPVFSTEELFAPPQLNSPSSVEETSRDTAAFLQGQQQEKEKLPTLSPLTCSLADTNTMTTAEAEAATTTTPQGSYYYSASPSQDSFLQVCTPEQRLYECHKAEARMVLHWIQQGVGQAIKDGKLARVIFGVCTTSTATTDRLALEAQDGSSGCSANYRSASARSSRNEHEDLVHHLPVKRLKLKQNDNIAKDKLVETYAVSDSCYYLGLQYADSKIVCSNFCVTFDFWPLRRRFYVL